MESFLTVVKYHSWHWSEICSSRQSEQALFVSGVGMASTTIFVKLHKEEGATVDGAFLERFCYIKTF